MYQYLTSFHNPLVECSTQQEWTDLINNILIDTHGVGFVLEFDSMWEELCSKHNVKNRVLLEWDNKLKTVIASWEGSQELTEFIESFFQHPKIAKGFETFKNNGWTINTTKMYI